MKGKELAARFWEEYQTEGDRMRRGGEGAVSRVTIAYLMMDVNRNRQIGEEKVRKTERGDSRIGNVGFFGGGNVRFRLRGEARNLRRW